MAAACLRRLASSLAASGAALAASRSVRVIGKGAAGAAAGAATYTGAEYALGETVPYAGGRRRGPEPLWASMLGGALLGHLAPASARYPAASDFVELGYPELEHQVRTCRARAVAAVVNGRTDSAHLLPAAPCSLQLGPDGLGPVPAGQIMFHWIRPESEAELRAGVEEVYNEPYRQAVEASVQAVVAALRQEAEDKRFGEHVLVSGAGTRLRLRFDALPNSDSTLPSRIQFAPGGAGEQTGTTCICATQEAAPARTDTDACPPTPRVCRSSRACTWSSFPGTPPWLKPCRATPSFCLPA